MTLFATIYLVFGWQSVKYQFGYNFMGVFFLTAVGYIEHYGIVRNRDEDGIYESISLMHAWNSRSGPVLFRLQRHSDHHSHSFRPY